MPIRITSQPRKGA